MVIYKSKPSLPEKAHEKFITRFLEAAPFNQVELENSKRETKKRGRFLFVSFTTRKKVCAISYLVEMSADKQKPQNRHEPGLSLCNTPSSQEGTMSTPKGYVEGTGRNPTQVREGTYVQLYPNAI